MEEITAIDAFPWSERSCILIDDARLFLGPPGEPYRREDWPSFIEVLDLLRARFPRFVTVLNDVIIAGPPQMQPIVDGYWLGVLERKEDAYSQMIRALNPPPATAARNLARAIAPTSARSFYTKVRDKLARRKGR